MVGMTVYSATSREDGSKLVSTRKGKVIDVFQNLNGRKSFKIHWEDKAEADTQYWSQNDVSFTAPTE